MIYGGAGHWGCLHRIRHLISRCASSITITGPDARSFTPVTWGDVPRETPPYQLGLPSPAGETLNSCAGLDGSSTGMCVGGKCAVAVGWRHTRDDHPLPVNRNDSRRDRARHSTPLLSSGEGSPWLACGSDSAPSVNFHTTTVGTAAFNRLRHPSAGSAGSVEQSPPDGTVRRDRGASPSATPESA
jgi:hypothetical protein